MSDYRNRYRNLLPLLIDGEYGQGDEFEKDLTPDEEAGHLASGLIEIVPCEWKVVGGSRVYDTDPGETFTAALTLGQQEHLVGGGFVARADAKPKRRSSSSSKTK